MKIKLLGTNIYISFWFCAVLTIMLVADKSGLALPMLLAVVLHESGHLFAMWLLGEAPKEIRLIPSSVQIVKTCTASYKNDVLVAVFGPLVNFILSVAFFIGKSPYFATVNLLVGLFNTLPLAGLDGGTVIYSLICRKHTPKTAKTVLNIITVAFALTLFGFAVFLYFNGKTNITVFILIIYLFLSVIIKK